VNPRTAPSAVWTTPVAALPCGNTFVCGQYRHAIHASNRIPTTPRIFFFILRLLRQIENERALALTGTL
jgi:hypothetical protein